jgi:hypothetical protein
MSCIRRSASAAIGVVSRVTGPNDPQSPIQDERFSPEITGPRDQSTHVPPGYSPGHGSGSIDVFVARPIGGGTFGKKRVTRTAAHPDPGPHHRTLPPYNANFP